ncbi:MAG: DNA-binding transcriptional LysR family regulator [Ascidiaceihabitans sp.]
MKLSLKQLEAFVWVADLGSFRKAADRLNTTQPNVSSRIATLETLLNQSLMERDAGSVRLTTKGRKLLDHARKVLRAVDDFADASSEASLIDGTLRLGVTEMIVHTWLSDFLKVLNTTFPQLHVELTVDLSVNLERELSARSIDLALQNGPFRQQMIGQIPLGDYPLVWVATRESGLRGIKNPTMDHIAAYPILTHSRDTRLYAETAAHFGARKDLNVRLVPSSNLAACLHMTLNGMGVATLPAAMVSRELNSGALIRIDYEWQPEHLEFFARYDADRAPSFVAKAAEIAQRLAALHQRT